jgi:hypothetical protein
MEQFAQLDDSELGSRKTHNLELIFECSLAGLYDKLGFVPVHQATLAGGIDSWPPLNVTNSVTGRL